MGFDPRAVDRMSLWEFFVCVDGWVAANCPEQDDAPAVSEDEYIALVKAQT